MAKKTRIRLALGAAVGAFVTVLSVHAPVAQGQDVSLKGKSVQIIISSSPGGGADATARLIGNSLVKYLPGSPAVVYRNLPGGSGLKAHNYFANQVAPDGLTLLSGSRPQISPVKLRKPQVKYDPSKYEFVGGDANPGTLLVIRKEALPRLTDPTAKPVVYGDIDGTRSGVLIALWGKEFLGWNLRWVVGYSGTSAMMMSLQSGEVDMAADQDAYTVLPLIKTGNFVGLAQLGTLDDNNKRIVREAFAPAPLLEELILPHLGDKHREIFVNMMADFIVNKWITLPPATPAPIVETYRAAYMKAVADREFLNLAVKERGEEFSPLSGKQMNAIAAELVATPDEDFEFVNALRKKYNLPVE